MSKTANAIQEVSSEEDSENVDEIEESENSIIINKENAKLLDASLDLIDKKKRESFINNMRLSVKDPLLDFGNKEIFTETRTKIEMLLKNRREIEIQIEQKVIKTWKIAYLLKKSLTFWINTRMKYTNWLKT